MFGHQNDQKKDDQHDEASTPDHSIDGVISPDSGTSAKADDTNPKSDWQHPGTPLDDERTDTGPANSHNETANTNSHGESTTDKASSPSPGATPGTPHELIDIKQQALGQLSPLVDHLEQSPEERFRTLMMMIQASDDQSKVKEAYETAQKIDDEKVRAQALLDIVNEINYFTQPHES